MKTIRQRSIDGEPSRTTHRLDLTKQVSANAGLLFHIFSKTFWQDDRSQDEEQVEALIRSMEIYDGLAA